MVVTGGAKGIGKAIVEKFLTENYRVAILDYDSQSGQQFLEDHPNNKEDILFIKTDISNNNSVENAKKKLFLVLKQ